jgi:hypothetical protein
MDSEHIMSYGQWDSDQTGTNLLDNISTRTFFQLFHIIIYILFGWSHNEHVLCCHWRRRSYSCDSMSFPTLLSLWRRPKPIEGAVVGPLSISALQRGHSAFILSHLSTQSLWKKWVQGSSRSSSLFKYLARQIQQICVSKNTRQVLD